MSILNFFRKSARLKPFQISLEPKKSYHIPAVNLVISSKGVWLTPNPKGEAYRALKEPFAELVIGAPGLPNVKKTLELGDAVLYQTPDFGVVEVRVTELGPPTLLMISVVSPRSGFAAAYDGDALGNAHFASDESAKIAQAIDSVGQQMRSRSDISPEQLAFLSEKLTEIVEASKRLGRKDWIMFVAGTLTNVVVAAAFAPDAAKALFTALNTELSWVFQNMLRLMGR